MYVIRRIVAFAAVFSIFLLSGFWRAGEIIDPEIAERYGTDERIAEALRNFNASEKAELIASKNTEEAIVSLTFDGLNDLDVMEAVIAITKRYNIKATFFVPGVEVAEYGNIVTSLKEAGHEIGSYTLYGTSHMQEFPARELIRNFIYSSVIIEDALGEAPGYLKCRNTEYTERVLYAASVSGFGHVVRSDHNLSFQSFKEYKDAQNYINRLPKGSIVSVKMRGVLEPGEFTPSATPSPTPEIHLLPSEVPRPEETPQIQLSETERLLNVVEWLCRAVYESEREVLFVKDLPFARLAEDGGIQGNSETERLAEETRPAKARNLGQERAAQQKAEAQRRLEEQKRIDAFWLETVASLRDANAGKLAKEINMVYTTERAASFVFYGIINGEAFEDTLRTLDALGISGTFFVSDEDIEQHPERIDAIIQSGNELGIAYLPKSDRDFDAAALNIIKTSQLLNDRYGISAKLVKQPFSSISDDLREVVSMMGLTLVNHGVSVVRSDDEYEVSADNIVKKLYTGGKDSVARGEIIYFRMDFYKASNTLIGELARRFKELYVDSPRFPSDTAGEYAYTIKSLGGLLNNTKYLYNYPLNSSSIIPSRLNAIYPGHLNGIDDDEIFEIIRKGYIGSPSVSSESMLPGYTQKHVDALDHDGRVDTGGSKTIFLSFDDWGTDKSVNYLLYVLKKHNVKATFFIRTNYVYANPNLLRAIAMEGHDISSHTDSHYTLSNYDAGTRTYSSLSEAQVKELEADLVKSYNTLVNIAGDIKNERGTPTVTRHFRAPTLAQSYLGMRTVADCGFTYSISGDFSTGDYAMRSAGELLNAFNNGLPFANTVLTLQPGSVVVMHMSADAAYTAEALDLFFTQNEAKPAGERFTFARLSDYLN